MTASVFVDSNVLLYALDQRDQQKQKSARAWRSELWVSRRGRISFQVLNEFYVNAIRIQPAAYNAIRAEIRDLFQWNPVPLDAALLELGWKIQDRYRLSHWDALIVAAAKTASCLYLLSEDFQPGQKLDGIQIVNPFLKDPWSLSPSG